MFFDDKKKEEKSEFRQKFETFTEGVRLLIGRDPVERTIRKSVQEYIAIKSCCR